MKKDVYNLSKTQETVELAVSKKIFKDVEIISKENNVSSYSVFLAVLYVLLYNYTYQNNLKIFLKKYINLEQNFSDFVKSVHEDTETTLANLLRDFLTLDKGTSSLNILFTYRNLADNALTAEDSIPKFDLNFEVLPSSNVLNLEFNSDLFTLSSAKSLLSHYFFVLKQILKDTNCKLSNIKMVTPEETRLLEKFNKKGITLDNDAFLSYFDTDKQKLQVYVLDHNLKSVPIGNIR